METGNQQNFLIHRIILTILLVLVSASLFVVKNSQENCVTDNPVETQNFVEKKQEAPVQEDDKSIKVDKLIPIAGDSIWDKEGENPKQIKVDSISTLLQVGEN